MSVYKVIDIIGNSPVSWEQAATEAVERARASVEDIRVARVIEQDMAVAHRVCVHGAKIAEISAVTAHSTSSSHTRCPHHARPMSPCCRIQACMAIPAATPALMLRVEPNWAIDTVIAAPARVSSVMPGPS